MRSGFAFLVAFAGAALSLWLFGHVFNNYGFAVICTLSAMVIYFCWILWIERYRKNYEKYADSVYYLGFMLTLIALLVALWGIGGNENSFVDVVQKFGLGLSTTLLGLVGRIWMLEFGINPERIDEQVAIKLQESAQELALQLHQGRGVLKHAYDDLTKQVLEQQSVIANLVGGTARDFSAEIKAITSEIRQSAADSSRELAAVTQNTAKEIEDSGKAMARALQGSASVLQGTLSVGMITIQGTLRDFETAVAAVRIPPDLFERGLSAALAGVEKSFTQLEAAVSAGTAAAKQMEIELETVKNAAAEVAACFAAAKNTAGALSDANQLIASLNGAIAGFDTELQNGQNQISEHIKIQVASAAQFQEIVADQLKTMKDLSAQLEEDLRASTAATSQVHEELARNARFIVEKLGG